MKNNLSPEEWNELIHLKNTISDNPFSVTPEKQELFTELFVKSLAGKGEYQIYKEPSNF